MEKREAAPIREDVGIGSVESGQTSLIPPLDNAYYLFIILYLMPYFGRCTSLILSVIIFTWLP